MKITMSTYNAHLKLWLHVEDGCSLATAEPLVEIADMQNRGKFKHVVRGTSAAGVAFGDSGHERAVPV
jgi:hypothetical protein